MNVRSYVSLIKMMLKNSYSFSEIIDEDTGKINKKSIKVWGIAIISFAVVYFSYAIFNELKEFRSTRKYAEYDINCITIIDSYTINSNSTKFFNIFRG